MRAAPELQVRLLELAEVDAEHARLQHTASNMPEQQHLVSIEDQRREKRLAAADARGALDDVEAELARIRDDASLVAERRALDEERLATATSTKDIAALEAELATLRRRTDTLTEQELLEEERAEQRRAEFERAHSEMTEIEDLAADLLRRRELAREHIREAAKDLHLRRQALVGALPKELLAEYERARKRSGIGAAELVGDTSTASQEQLGAAEMAQIRALAPDELAYCPSSGAVLVRTARSNLQ